MPVYNLVDNFRAFAQNSRLRHEARPEQQLRARDERIARRRREVNLERRDAAVAQLVRLEGGGELGPRRRKVGAEVAPEELAEEVGVADEDRALVIRVAKLVQHFVDTRGGLKMQYVNDRGELATVGKSARIEDLRRATELRLMPKGGANGASRRI